MADTPWYPMPQPDGVPDAYRLHPSGTVIYRGFGDRWHGWDSKLPLRIAPSTEALDAATPLYLSGQAVARLMPVCDDPECTIPRKPGRPPHGPHIIRAGKPVVP